MKSAVTCDGKWVLWEARFARYCNGRTDVTIDGVLTSDEDVICDVKAGRDKVATPSPTWPIVAGVIALWKFN
jgi:hypothetical protein